MPVVLELTNRFLDIRDDLTGTALQLICCADAVECDDILIENLFKALPDQDYREERRALPTRRKQNDLPTIVGLFGQTELGVDGDFLADFVGQKFPEAINAYLLDGNRGG